MDKIIYRAEEDRIYENLRTSRSSSEVPKNVQIIQRLEEAINYNSEPKVIPISESTWEILLKSIDCWSQFSRNKAILDGRKNDWLEIIVRNPQKLFWIIFGSMFLVVILCYFYSLFK